MEKITVAVFRTMAALYGWQDAQSVRGLEELNSYYSDKTNRFIDVFSFKIPETLRLEINDNQTGVILSRLNVSFSDLELTKDFRCVGVFRDHNTLKILIKR